jgi:sRNA-binding regulator protein Hfq
MPYQPVPKSRAQQKPRFNYAVETVVDRCVREQNRFLDHCREHRTPLVLFFVTGSKITGIVHDYDRESIEFGGTGKEATKKIFMKAFIALMIPREPIELFLEYRGLGTSRRKNRKQRFLDAMQARRDSGAVKGVGELTCQRKRAPLKANTRNQKLSKSTVITSEGVRVTGKPKGRRVTLKPDAGA